MLQEHLKAKKEFWDFKWLWSYDRQIQCQVSELLWWNESGINIPLSSQISEHFLDTEVPWTSKVYLEDRQLLKRETEDCSYYIGFPTIEKEFHSCSFAPIPKWTCLTNHFSSHVLITLSSSLPKFILEQFKANVRCHGFPSSSKPIFAWKLSDMLPWSCSCRFKSGVRSLLNFYQSLRVHQASKPCLTSLPINHWALFSMAIGFGLQERSGTSLLRRPLP